MIELNQTTKNVANTPTHLQTIGQAFETIGRRVYLVAGENKIHLTVDDKIKIAFDLKGNYLPRG